jgi:hypothetical protein
LSGKATQIERRSVKSFLATRELCDQCPTQYA